MSVTEMVGEGITRIDADYVKPGVASFYLLESAGEFAVIETGTRHSVAALHAVLESRGIAPEQVRFVIPTHVHLDHAGGAGVMMADFPEATLLVHPRGARHMIDPAKLEAASRTVYGDSGFEKLYGELVPVPGSRVHEVAEGEVQLLGSRPLLFRHTLGHAKHHMCIWDAQTSGWFTGDMFGVCYPWYRFESGNFLLPATTPSQFDPGDYLASLELLAQMNPRRMYLTHFSAVDYSQASAQLLARQVQGYADIARATPDDELEPAVEAFSLDLLRSYAPDKEEAALRHMLALDMPLNVMGLRSWRDAG